MNIQSITYQDVKEIILSIAKKNKDKLVINFLYSIIPKTQNKIWQKHKSNIDENEEISYIVSSLLWGHT